MPAVTLIRRAANKAHPTAVPETDTGLLAGLELSAAGTAALYTDSFTTGITVGSSGITTVVASELQVNLSIFGPSDGTGIVVGSTPAGASTGSTLQFNAVTTVQRNQLVAANGMVVYNNTTGTLEGYNGTWIDILAAGTTPPLASVLAAGATTGANDITITTGQSLLGAAELTLASATTSAASLDSGTTGAVNVGTGANAKAVTVGSTTGASSLTIRGGTGTVTITQAGGDAITVGQVGGAGTGSALGLVNMTTTQRNANLTGSAGMLIWNTTDTTVNQHDGTAWGPLTPFSNTATATADTTTTSATDVLVNSMTLTPASGTYLVWFTSSAGTSAQTNIFFSIWSGGAQVAASELFQFTRGGRDHSFSCVAKVTVNGSQAIEGRWRTTVGTATMHQRSLVIMKVV